MKHITVKYQQPAIIHAAHPVPGSMSDTLCGVMLSGHESSTASKINCPACVRIITACKGVPRDDYYKPHKKPVKGAFGCSNITVNPLLDPCPRYLEYELDEDDLAAKQLITGNWKPPAE